MKINCKRVMSSHWLSDDMGVHYSSKNSRRIMRKMFKRRYKREEERQMREELEDG